MREQLAVWAQHLLPKQALTQLAGRLADLRGGMLTAWAIQAFARHYRVNMSEAAQPDLRCYPSFNDFFTRALHPSARPLGSADLLCPADGAISQCGPIHQGQLIQAKDHRYAVADLLADPLLAEQLDGGQFATLYLAPRDYHRLHMPCAGRLQAMTYIPGTLYSVNPLTARQIPGLFARNERVVCVFDSDLVGRFALVLVGATIVGSICTRWHGPVCPPRGGDIQRWHYGTEAAAHATPQDVVLARGEEFAQFRLGSTIVALFPPGRINLLADWQAGRPVQVLRDMAHLRPPTDQVQ